MQTRELLVFDDPLALSACHFCAIPTTFWAADWRVLLRAPAEGLALLTKLEEAAWRCMEEQFLSSEAWCAKHLRGPPPTDEESRVALRSHVVCGCNFPPSQVASPPRPTPPPPRVLPLHLRSLHVLPMPSPVPTYLPPALPMPTILTTLTALTTVPAAPPVLPNALAAVALSALH